MIPLLLTLFPKVILGAVTLVLGLFLKSKMDGLKARALKKTVASDVIENHVVAQKEEAAQTDEEADAALDADAQSDRT